jgi:hypothetical protein
MLRSKNSIAFQNWWFNNLCDPFTLIACLLLQQYSPSLLFSAFERSIARFVTRETRFFSSQLIHFRFPSDTLCKSLIRNELVEMAIGTDEGIFCETKCIWWSPAWSCFKELGSVIGQTVLVVRRHWKVIRSVTAQGRIESARIS